MVLWETACAVQFDSILGSCRWREVTLALGALSLFRAMFTSALISQLQQYRANDRIVWFLCYCTYPSVTLTIASGSLNGMRVPLYTIADAN